MQTAGEDIRSAEPVVALVNHFAQPFNNAVATARTCYSSKVIYSEDVGKDDKSLALRDKIAQSTYQAGHHTTLQHATFQFVLENVSRQFLWSFLHSHPFYNSEQVSQRYVEVKPDRFFIPPIEGDALSLYVETIRGLMDAYHELIRLLDPTIRSEYKRIFPMRNLEEKRWQNAMKKRAQEVARYVLPIATHAHLYHTISGLTLHRYHRLLNQPDTPLEQGIVVRKMVEAVNQTDPDFFKFLEDPLPLEQTPEYLALQQFPFTATEQNEFIENFDKSLDGHVSKLTDYKAHAEATMAEAVRTVLGATPERLSDDEAIELVMNPAQNSHLSESLNVMSLSKLTRTMVHPHFTFRKKLSHTADSQDQRHRMTPGSRPIFSTQVRPGRPDYITPVLIQMTPAAKDFYDATMDKLWGAMEKLLNSGVKEEFAFYLLPNAFPIRFEESGDLLHFHHKWSSRLCYTAQEEIWNSCFDEVRQVRTVSPRIAKYILAPCSERKAIGAKPFCPEGDRFCGVRVWEKQLEQYVRTI